MPPLPPASSSLGGFSIREYTSQKRAADVTKCWPFDLLSDGEAASYAAFLPPIRVVKFRWWLDVLASSRYKNQIDAIHLLGPVVPRSSCCVSRGGDDSDDRRRNNKNKKKKKKKRERSIVEIFAVSPRVATRTKKEARGMSRKRNEKKRKRVEAGMKSRDPITSTRASEAKVFVPEMDKVMLQTLPACLVAGMPFPPISLTMFNLAVHEITDSFGQKRD